MATTTEAGLVLSLLSHMEGSSFSVHLPSLSILKSLYQAMAAHQYWELYHSPSMIAMITQQLLIGL